MDATSAKAYEEIAGAIIQKQVLVLGKLIALERARKAQGLTLGEDGNVQEIIGNAIDVLENLIDQYRELLGPAAISFAKDAARPTIAKNQGLSMPRALQS